MKTKQIKKSEIKRDWCLLDAQDKVLGRLSTEIACLLMGKGKPFFAPHLDVGDFIVVINAAKVKVTGAKILKKKYYHHSGYPGGFKEITFGKQLEKDPTKIIRHAVSGMLPKNKLRTPRLKRLKIFVDEKHPYQDKFKANSKNAKSK